MGKANGGGFVKMGMANGGGFGKMGKIMVDNFVYIGGIGRGLGVNLLRWIRNLGEKFDYFNRGGGRGTQTVNIYTKYGLLLNVYSLGRIGGG